MYLDRYPSLEDFLEGRRMMCTKMHQIKDNIKQLRSDELSESNVTERLLEKELERSQKIYDTQNDSFEFDLKMFNQLSNESLTGIERSDKLLNFHEVKNDKQTEYSLKINKGCFFKNPYLLFKMQLSNLDPDTISYFLYIAISMSCGNNIFSLHTISTNIFIANMCDKNISEYIHEGEFCTRIPLMIFHNILYEDAFKYDDIDISIFGLGYESYKIGIPQLGFDGFFEQSQETKIKLINDPISKSVFMDSDEYQFSLSEIKMKISPRTKILIIRFVTKINKDNHELLSLQPNITEMSMIKDDVMVRTFSNILSLKIMGVTLFVVPLLSDATNWRDLKRMIRSDDSDSTGQLSIQSSIEESLYDFGTVILKLTTDIPIQHDRYDALITSIKFNISYCNSFTGLTETFYNIFAE
jgi:hypothetical protein